MYRNLNQSKKNSVFIQQEWKTIPLGVFTSFLLCQPQRPFKETSSTYEYAFWIVDENVEIIIYRVLIISGQITIKLIKRKLNLTNAKNFWALNYSRKWLRNQLISNGLIEK